MCFPSRSPDETRRLAATLAAVLDAEGAVVTLAGDLGAGKTVFAKGLAEGLGLDPARVASPTFVIAYDLEAPGGLRFVHADAYRLGDPDELEAAGLADWLAPRTLLALEWGERFPEALPDDRLEVRLEPAQETAETPPEGGREAGSEASAPDGPPAGEAPTRRLRVRAGGARSEALLARWRERWR